MECTGYYRILDHSQNNIADESDLLIVNCTGRMYRAEPFVSMHKYGRVDYYIMYVVHGVVEVTINKKVYYLKSGMGISYYPNTPLDFECTNNKTCDYYWVHFTGSLAKSIMERAGLHNETIFNIGVQAKIINLFEKMTTEIIGRKDDFAFSASTYLLQILTEIKRNSKDNIKQQNLPRFQESIRMMHSNYNQPISIEELAQIENISESRYRVIFKQITGLSPKQYLTDIRMRRACELLSTSDFSPEEIGTMVGYPDMLYFYRIFKKNNNITPSQFRIQSKKSRHTTNNN